MVAMRDEYGNWVAAKKDSEGNWVPKFRPKTPAWQKFKQEIAAKRGTSNATSNTTTNTATNTATNTTTNNYTPPKVDDNIGPVLDWPSIVNKNFGKQTMNAGGLVRGAGCAQRGHGKGKIR